MENNLAVVDMLEYAGIQDNANGNGGQLAFLTVRFWWNHIRSTSHRFSETGLGINQSSPH